MRSALLARVRSALQAAADPIKAPQMRAYMKSAMPYHGVPTPLMRRICRELFADLEYAAPAAWKGEMLALWRGAKFREERYAALNLAAHRSSRPFQTPDAMPLYEELIVTGAWWDYVDDIASHRVGTILRAHPDALKPMMRSWSRSANLWKRRTSIICQLGSKREIDLKLLYDCIEPSIGSSEFFLRKAIGWALRQHAWVDPGEVRRYVKAHDALSPLSKREALKNVGR
ncbi:MAG: DNA alkylation repair protein [Elusimicrobiota bacterium]